MCLDDDCDGQAAAIQQARWPESVNGRDVASTTLQLYSEYQTQSADSHKERPMSVSISMWWV
jgi:hypothetical protein